MIYMDSSALVTLFTHRDYVKDLRGYLKGRPKAPMATNTIGFVETIRNSSQHGHQPMLQAEMESAITEIILTEEVKDTAAQLPGRIKALDALHIATAISIADYLTVLVSYDRKMLAIAKEQGLPTASPGMN